ncbi:hypothetical protein PROFUN_15924, partial [Planoprotostelium fungivorum]
MWHLSEKSFMCCRDVKYPIDPQRFRGTSTTFMNSQNLFEFSIQNLNYRRVFHTSLGKKFYAERAKGHVIDEFSNWNSMALSQWSNSLTLIFSTRGQLHPQWTQGHHTTQACPYLPAKISPLSTCSQMSRSIVIPPPSTSTYIYLFCYFWVSLLDCRVQSYQLASNCLVAPNGVKLISNQQHHYINPAHMTHLSILSCAVRCMWMTAFSKVESPLSYSLRFKPQYSLSTLTEALKSVYRPASLSTKNCAVALDDRRCAGLIAKGSCQIDSKWASCDAVVDYSLAIKHHIHLCSSKGFVVALVDLLALIELLGRATAGFLGVPVLALMKLRRMPYTANHPNRAALLSLVQQHRQNGYNSAFRGKASTRILSDTTVEDDEIDSWYADARAANAQPPPNNVDELWVDLRDATVPPVHTASATLPTTTALLVLIGVLFISLAINIASFIRKVLEAQCTFLLPYQDSRGKRWCFVAPKGRRKTIPQKEVWGLVCLALRNFSEELKKFVVNSTKFTYKIRSADHDGKYKASGGGWVATGKGYSVSSNYQGTQPNRSTSIYMRLPFASFEYRAHERLQMFCRGLPNRTQETSIQCEREDPFKHLPAEVALIILGKLEPVDLAR